MSCQKVPTSGLRLKFKIGVISTTPIDLILKGYDPDHANSTYFERDIPFFKGGKEFEVPMPMSPEKLIVCASEKGGLRNIPIRYIKAEPLIQKPLPFSSSRDFEFYGFISWFCKNCGHLKPDIYYSKNKNFEIKLSDKIREEDGSVSSTPARVFKPYGEIEVSKDKFDKMTVFMRMMILLHEYFHVRVNTRNEEVCDWYAVETYKAMGFPETEALYSFIKVFKPVNEQHEQALIKRTDKLFNYLKFN